MSKDFPFLGTGWSFPPTFNNISGTVEMTSGEEDIQKSLEILISTSLGERMIEPTYGCNLHDLVFDPLDEAMTAYIKDLVTNAVLYHEPRIILEEVQLDENQENGQLFISLEYTIPSTNSRSNYVFPFFLREGTEIDKAYKKSGDKLL